MSAPSLLNAAGRRRSPVTVPGYLAGRPPRNKGLRYPPDPPTVEEIVAVMRQAGDGIHGARMRAFIVLLWRAGLRITEALTVTEHDLEPGAGSVLVRHGKGGRRREVGMDPWGWDHLRPWLELRIAMPVGPLLCVIDGPTCGWRWASDSARAQLRRVATKARVRRRFAPHQLRHAHAVELAHEGIPLKRHPAPIGAHQPRGHVHISARDRQRRDHRHRPCPQDADDPRQHRTPHVSRPRPAVEPELLASKSSVPIPGWCSSSAASAEIASAETSALPRPTERSSCVSCVRSSGRMLASWRPTASASSGLWSRRRVRPPKDCSSASPPCRRYGCALGASICRSVEKASGGDADPTRSPPPRLPRSCSTPSSPPTGRALR
jgi:Phage integrase family